MKKVFFLTMIFICISQQHNVAFAAPTQAEIDQLISEVGMTNQELIDYLAYYEETIDSFEDIEELKSYLGAPIDEDNLTQLLTDYQITREELDALLADFGETLDDYYFIEDLDLEVSFLLDHDGEMKEFEDFLSAIGLAEDEVDALFNHFVDLDLVELEARMVELESDLDPFLSMTETSELSTEEQNQLISVWEEMMDIFQLKPEFFLIDKNDVETAATFKELTNMTDMYENDLLIRLYNIEGNLLLDMRLSEEMLNSDFIIESGQQIAGLGNMAGELTELLHSQLPETSSPFGLNMMIGFITLLFGAITYLLLRKMKQV